MIEGSFRNPHNSLDRGVSTGDLQVDCGAAANIQCRVFRAVCLAIRTTQWWDDRRFDSYCSAIIERCSREKKTADSRILSVTAKTTSTRAGSCGNCDAQGEDRTASSETGHRSRQPLVGRAGRCRPDLARCAWLRRLDVPATAVLSHAPYRRPAPRLPPRARFAPRLRHCHRRHRTGRDARGLSRSRLASNRPVAYPERAAIRAGALHAVADPVGDLGVDALVFWGRYRVTVVGKDEVLAKPGPYLILPNHPALADPPNLLAHLWPSFKMRPLLLESNFKNPLLRPFKYILRAIDMPDIIRASAEDRRRAEEAVAEVIAALRARGERHPLAERPALARRIGEARRRADRRRRARRGARASRSCSPAPAGFSAACSAGPMASPHFGRSLAKAFGLWLANLFLFAPRRRVTVTLEAFTSDRRPEPTREAVNRWLEEWYNADTPRETPTFVPHHFLFGPRTHEFPPPPAPAEFDLTKVKPETKTAVAAALSRRRRSVLSPRARTCPKRHSCSSVSTASMRWKSRLRSNSGSASPATRCPPRSENSGHWLRGFRRRRRRSRRRPAGSTPVDDEPLTIPGETVAEAFLNQALGRKRMVIVADDLAGGMTYEKARHRRVGDGRAVPRNRCSQRRSHAARVGGLRPRLPGAALWRANCRWC